MTTTTKTTKTTTTMIERVVKIRLGLYKKIKIKEYWSNVCMYEGRTERLEHIYCTGKQRYMKEKLILAIVTGHTTLPFDKIFRMIHTFLPVLHELQNPAAVEVHSNTSQPAMHGYLDCLVVFIVLASHVIFQGPGQMVGSRRVTSPDCIMAVGALPSHSLRFLPISDVRCEV